MVKPPTDQVLFMTFAFIKKKKKKYRKCRTVLLVYWNYINSFALLCGLKKSSIVSIGINGKDRSSMLDPLISKERLVVVVLKTQYTEAPVYLPLPEVCICCQTAQKGTRKAMIMKHGKVKRHISLKAILVTKCIFVDNVVVY